MSPVADLSPVAAAGRTAGNTYRAMVNESGFGPALQSLYRSLRDNVGQGGKFDYQRQGSFATGFTQLPDFRDVSGFNAGLFCQQAGFSLNETLLMSGVYAFGHSSNSDHSGPYRLDSRTAGFIIEGYKAGARGIFGQPAKGLWR
jgi:hypothetical protein